MTATTFAQQLAANLSRVLPPGFAATAVGECVQINAPDGLGSRGWLAIIDDVDQGAERFEIAAQSVLSTPQDVVSQTSGMPWPRASGVKWDLALPFTA